MLENLDNLSLRDKNFMINNPSSFSLPSRVLINFNAIQWQEDINNGLDKNTIEADKSDNERIKRTISEAPCDIDIPQLSDIYSKLFRRIWISPCETKEDICDIISQFNIIYDRVYREDYFVVNADTKRYMRNICIAFFEILRYKLRAHLIVNDNSMSIAPADSSLRDYMKNELRYLMEEFIVSNSTSHIAMIIFMMNNYLNITTSSGRYVNFYYLSRELHNTDISYMDSLIKDMEYGKINALDIIDNVPDINVSGFGKEILKDAKRVIENNYQKNKVSDKGIHDELVIGDDVFSDTGISLNSLLIEIKKLDEDSIRNYIGGNKNVSYMISAREVGYLKVKENMPVCKLMDKRGQQFTMTRYNGKPYLLFKVFGKENLFGLSFPCEYEGERKLISFEIPDNLDYKLEI